MAYSLTSERPAVAARSTTVLSGFAAWLDQARIKRNRRVALAALLEFDNALLDDIGLSRQDVVDAIASPGGSGPRLHARRAAKAKAWFR